MRANHEIDEEEFRERKATLLEEKKRLQALQTDTDRRIDNWLEIAERGFNFAEKANQTFTSGGMEKRKDIFINLGSNFTLQDKKLTITLDNLLIAIQNLNSVAPKDLAGLEPLETPMNKGKAAAFTAARPIWLRGWDSNPRPSD